MRFRKLTSGTVLSCWLRWFVGRLSEIKYRQVFQKGISQQEEEGGGCNLFMSCFVVLLGGSLSVNRGQTISPDVPDLGIALFHNCFGCGW